MSTAPDLLAAVAGVLDLSGALDELSNNDLLPPRIDDKVAGQLRAGWLARLETAVTDGVYQPQPADFIFVPKPRFASRPAALLQLEDRVLYTALVARIRAKVERVLLGAETVYWPRGSPTAKRWRDFDRAPLSHEPTHVVLADVAGFYESIGHQRLREVLLDVAGDRPLVDALIAFLTVVMGGTRGLPQGLEPSDPLATAYLASADAHIARAGLRHVRNGDDLRIAASSYPEALRAAHVLEAAIRSCGLLVNASKLQILTKETYEDSLHETEDATERLQEELRQEAADALLDEGDREDVEQLLVDLGVAAEDDLHDYGEPISMSELVDRLRPYIKPTAADIAAALLDEAMELRPGGAVPRDDQLDPVHFHERVIKSLRALSAADDHRAIQYAATLLGRHADETETVAGYLLAVCATAANEVSGAIEVVLSEDTFMLGWQRAWLYRVLSQIPSAVSDDVMSRASVTAASDAYVWNERIEAARLLARAGKLDQTTMGALWERAPTVYRADLIAASVWASGNGLVWAERFRDSAREHPVHAVVLHQLGIHAQA